MEAVSFPAVEAALVAFLGPQIAPVKAAMSVPKERPARFVKITRVGGRRSSLVHDEATVVFECWAESPYEAESLALRVRALVGSLDTPTVWYASEVGGPASFPDPETSSPRYQFTALIRSQGEAI